jgi:hypothetical protein
LEPILGPNAAGLSAANVVRLKLGWEEEYEKWATRDQAPLSYATRIKAPTSGMHRAARHQTPPQTLPVTQPSAPQICRTATSQLSLARWTPQISIL